MARLYNYTSHPSNCYVSYTIINHGDNATNCYNDNIAHSYVNHTTKVQFLHYTGCATSHLVALLHYHGTLGPEHCVIQVISVATVMYATNCYDGYTTIFNCYAYNIATSTTLHRVATSHLVALLDGHGTPWPWPRGIFQAILLLAVLLDKQELFIFMKLWVYYLCTPQFNPFLK